MAQNLTSPWILKDILTALGEFENQVKKPKKVQVLSGFDEINVLIVHDKEISMSVMLTHSCADELKKSINNRPLSTLSGTIISLVRNGWHFSTVIQSAGDRPILKWTTEKKIILPLAIQCSKIKFLGASDMGTVGGSTDVHKHPEVVSSLSNITYLQLIDRLKRQFPHEQRMPDSDGFFSTAKAYGVTLLYSLQFYHCDIPSDQRRIIDQLNTFDHTQIGGEQIVVFGEIGIQHVVESNDHTNKRNIVSDVDKIWSDSRKRVKSTGELTTSDSSLPATWAQSDHTQSEIFSQPLTENNLTQLQNWIPNHDSFSVLPETEAPQSDPLLGRQLRRFFIGHGYFRGHAASKNGDVYLVKYADGDEEELPTDVLDALLVSEDEAENSSSLLTDLLMQERSFESGITILEPCHDTTSSSYRALSSLQQIAVGDILWDGFGASGEPIHRAHGAVSSETTARAIAHRFTSGTTGNEQACHVYIDKKKLWEFLSSIS
jgi:hypothetical protein